MSETRTAIVLGASGSVGGALVRALLHDGAFDLVITLGRKSLPDVLAMARASGRELREQLVPDMTPAALTAATVGALRDIDGDVAAFSVLGIGAGTANMSIDAHRAVDVELNAAFARGLRDAGNVRHLAYMTAVGADATASEAGSGAAGMARYNRVKGESEVAVRAQGPAVVSFFRPSMILGSKHTPWILAKLLPVFSVFTPSKFRSITAEQIAMAMIATTKAKPTTSAIYHYREMIDAIARGTTHDAEKGRTS
ncbi:hypothetical protein [Gemmatimonas sp.]|uniref:hypothetical protein n=1 Tax=Gemmatimonas sp. TaxID=1962908 RepID=UPI003341D495